MRMRTLVLLLVLIVLSAFAFANHQRRVETGTSFVGLMLKTSTTTAKDEKGRAVLSRDNVTITIMEPVMASTLNNGSPIRMATTVTVYDPLLELKDGTKVKTKITQGLYNCDEPEVYIKAIIALDKDDNVVVRNFDVNAVVGIAPDSQMNDVRKYVCKAVPNKAAPSSNKNYI